MYIGKVTGMVVSTKKNSKLHGCKFLIVELNTKEELVAVDNIGAGVGDRVIVTTGHNAIHGLEKKDMVPVDAIIVGIVD
jgi:ethanolamine utilization protein EutN